MKAKKGEVDQDYKELYDKEIDLIEQVFKAPDLPIERNFKMENISSLKKEEKQKPLAVSM